MCWFLGKGVNCWLLDQVSVLEEALAQAKSQAEQVLEREVSLPKQVEEQDTQLCWLAVIHV